MVLIADCLSRWSAIEPRAPIGWLRQRQDRLRKSKSCTRHGLGRMPQRSGSPFAGVSGGERARAISGCVILQTLLLGEAIRSLSCVWVARDGAEMLIYASSRASCYCATVLLFHCMKENKRTSYRESAQRTIRMLTRSCAAPATYMIFQTQSRRCRASIVWAR